MNDALQQQHEIVIPLSKKKAGFMVLCSLAFGLGTWLWTIAENQPLLRVLELIVGAVSGWVLFGVGVFFGTRLFFDKTPGLILDSKGIVDNSSAVAAGRILWEEITGMKIGSINGQKFLTIEVADPHKYVSRGNFLQRKLNAANMSMVGSPINISASVLKIKFEELVRLFAESYERFKQEKSENLP